MGTRTNNAHTHTHTHACLLGCCVFSCVCHAHTIHRRALTKGNSQMKKVWCGWWWSPQVIAGEPGRGAKGGFRRGQGSSPSCNISISFIFAAFNLAFPTPCPGPSPCPWRPTRYPFAFVTLFAVFFFCRCYCNFFPFFLCVRYRASNELNVKNLNANSRSRRSKKEEARAHSAK